MHPSERRAGRTIRRQRRLQRWVRDVLGIELMSWQVALFDAVIRERQKH